MKKRGNRDEMVIATKYTTNFRAGPSAGPNTIMANFSGNGTKSLHTSVEASLKKLQTNYIDLVSRITEWLVVTYADTRTSFMFTGGITRRAFLS